MFGHDVFISLDGGWRVLHGQRPVVDFFAQMGPAFYLLHAAGLALAGHAAAGLGYGTGIVAVLLSVWSVLLLRRRMAAVPFFLGCLFLVLLATAPYPLGFLPTQTAFSMKHNRYGFALLGLVMLECFLAEGDEEIPRQRFWSGFSTGLASALALFLKISYGLVGLGFAVLSVALGKHALSRQAGIGVGVLAVAAPMFLYLRFDFGAILREYRWLAEVNGPAVSFHAIAVRFYQDRLEFGAILLLTWLVIRRHGIEGTRRAVLAAATLLAIVMGTLLLLTNTQPGGHPLVAVAALLLMNEASRKHSPALMGLGGLLVVLPLTLDGAGLALALGEKAWRQHPAYGFQAKHLSGLVFEDSPFDHPNDNGAALVQYTEEAMDLLRRESRPEETVRGLGVSNPFSYAMLRRPPAGGAVNLSNTNLGEGTIPPRDMLLGDPDLLLLPVYPASGRVLLGMALEENHFLEGYRQVAESANWRLYRRQKLRVIH